MKIPPSFPSRRFGPSIQAAVFFGMTVLFSILAGGCSEDSSLDSSESPATASVSNNLKQVGMAVSNYSDEETKSHDKSPADTQAASKAPGPAPTPAVPRKIIYDARIELLVDSLTTAEQAVFKMIKEHDGFLAESDQSSVTSTQRRATWRVRVPVDRFEVFLAEVTHLGEVRQNHLGSQDVTEEYFDVDARIRNKQEEEKRLLTHLSESTGKLEDILAVERELSRVRGEVEQMQGRIRFLANRTALSTITIEAMEWKDYKPPVAAAFQTQLGRTFFNSVDNLSAFGKAILMVAVALIPWLPLILLGALLIRWLIRANRSSSRSRPMPLTPAQPTTA
jgi:Domain of unknown function (DUF4349)